MLSRRTCPVNVCEFRGPTHYPSRGQTTQGQDLDVKPIEPLSWVPSVLFLSSSVPAEQPPGDADAGANSNPDTNAQSDTDVSDQADYNTEQESSNQSAGGPHRPLLFLPTTHIEILIS